MKDPESKLALIAYQVESIARIACAIPCDHLARAYGRGLFLGVDSFLHLAPRLNNEMRKNGTLKDLDANAIKTQINNLRSDYEGHYAKIRDKMSAHQQDLDLLLLLEAWNEIDIATLTILADDVSAIWANFQMHGAVSSFPRPVELDDRDMLLCFSTLVADSTIRLGLDRVAATRPNTAGMIPNGIFQEKAVRVITAIDASQILISTGLEKLTSEWLLPEKAVIDLFVVDACSVIDNLFEDRKATAQVSSEDSLIKIWKSHNVEGIETLENFQRDVALEKELREFRNKFSAHIDPDIPFADLMKMFNDLPIQEISDYLRRIYQEFRNVCRSDIRTQMFLAHGREIIDVVAVAGTGAIKPFR